MTDEYRKRAEEFRANEEFAIDMDELHVKPLLKEYWDDANIIPIEKLRQEVDDSVMRQVLKRMDYGGLDKLVFPKTGYPVWISQRVRADNKKYDNKDRIAGVGFSIRVETQKNDLTEWDKLSGGFHDPLGFTPVYTFGVADVYRKGSKEMINWKEKGKERGFKYLAFYDTRGIVEDLINDDVYYEEHPNGDGTMGRYIRLKDVQHHKIDTLVSKSDSAKTQETLEQFKDE